MNKTATLPHQSPTYNCLFQHLNTKLIKFELRNIQPYIGRVLSFHGKRRMDHKWKYAH